MARGVSFPAGLRALIVLVLVHETCSVGDTRHCAPSSCGSIHNISYPFSLKGDPADCGDGRYSLSCENNQTVLYLYAGRYYVQEINYTEYTIRIVDSGIQEDNYSSIPHYFLDKSNFSSGDPYSLCLQVTPTGSSGLSFQVVFLKCEKPVNSSAYLDISTCFRSGTVSSNSSSSDSKRYRYVLFPIGLKAGAVQDLCQGEQLSLASLLEAPIDDPKSNSCRYFHSMMLNGFLLSWQRALCASCSRRDECYLDGGSNFHCQPKNGFLDRLSGVYDDVFHDLIPTMLIRGRFRDQILQSMVYYEGEVSILKSCLRNSFLRTAKPNKIGRVVPDDDASRGKPGGCMGSGLSQDPPIRLLTIIMINAGQYLVAKIVVGTPFVIAFLIYKWRRRHLSMYSEVEEFLQSHNNLSPIRYSYLEIRKMTNNFKDKLGEGGYGTVFRGTLRSDQLVAVKMLGKSKGNGQDFISEVAIIGRIHHVNIVQLIGYCVEGSKNALVYEFMSKGSLNKYIFSQEGSVSLSYNQMHEIALGVAHGMKYWHQGCDMQILHFDIKPHNILLDENFTPKISDFGLAKLCALEESSVSLTAVRGALGYMAPELFYRNTGGISYKADVYSFGMLLLEIASRRKNFNELEHHSSQVYFPTWIYNQLHDGKDIVIQDATQEEKEIVKKMIIVALWCIQMKPSDRPSMNKVVEMLVGEVEHLQMPLKPFLSSLDQGPTEDMEDSTSETYSSIQSSSEVSQSAHS